MKSLIYNLLITNIALIMICNGLGANSNDIQNNSNVLENDINIEEVIEPSEIILEEIIVEPSIETVEVIESEPEVELVPIIEPVEIVNYEDFYAPYNSGFKSFMSYKTITNEDSKQYRMQHTEAYTGNYGIRQVNGRYCVAIGSYYTSQIGQSFDLYLENGEVIPCILGDQKADAHTDSQNIITTANGCMSEFIVDYNNLNPKAKQMGDISYCDNWNSPIEKIRIYY